MSAETHLPREAREGPIFHPDWGTQAYAIYSASITGLDALLAMVFPMAADTARSSRFLEARRLKIENDFSGPWAIDVRQSMITWQVAMRVAAVEVYLQDALTFLALLDPAFIKSREAKQSFDYEALRTASDNDDVLWTFCNRWARNFVGDGGPQRWAAGLARSGLGHFEDTDTETLEGMWGFRHLRVHHGARFTREFLMRHRDLAARLVDGGLCEADLKLWSDTATRFVAAAETGIAGRLRSVLGAELIGVREEAELVRQIAALSERSTRSTANSTPAELGARVEQAMADAEARFKLMDELFGGGMAASPGSERS